MFGYRKIKTLSIILIIIGAISVGASFLMGGGDHHVDADTIHSELRPEDMDMRTKQCEVLNDEHDLHEMLRIIQYYHNTAKATPDHNHLG